MESKISDNATYWLRFFFASFPTNRRLQSINVLSRCMLTQSVLDPNLVADSLGDHTVISWRSLQ